jgi:hypothetical protein
VHRTALVQDVDETKDQVIKNPAYSQEALDFLPPSPQQQRHLLLPLHFRRHRKRRGGGFFCLVVVVFDPVAAVVVALALVLDKKVDLVESTHLQVLCTLSCPSSLSSFRLTFSLRSPSSWVTMARTSNTTTATTTAVFGSCC